MDCFNSFIPHTKGHGIHTHSDYLNELALFPTRFQAAAELGGLSPGHVFGCPRRVPEDCLLVSTYDICPTYWLVFILILFP